MVPTHLRRFVSVSSQLLTSQRLTSFILLVGLGAPRWAQMLWGTSGIGLHLPWAGSAGPYLSICLWLWLGVLDSIQGIGLGMMLLQVRSIFLQRFEIAPELSGTSSQTLSRVYVGAALAAAQVVSSSPSFFLVEIEADHLPTANSSDPRSQ